MDLATEVKSPPGHLDGVLGHSLYVRPEDRLREVTERTFHHTESDYIVEGLFDGMDLHQQISRRRRLIEGADLDALEYPLLAMLR